MDTFLKAALVVGLVVLPSASIARSVTSPTNTGLMTRAFTADDKMNVGLIYTGANGKSYAEYYKLAPKDMPFFDKPSGYRQYFGSKATWVDIFAAPPNAKTPDHVAGEHTEMVFVVAGMGNMQLSGGQTVVLQPGSVMILEDNKIPGHWGQVGPQGYVAIHLTLEGRVDLPHHH